MRVDYNIGCDGWTEYPNGRIEISDRAWKILSKRENVVGGVIPCQFAFVTTEHLMAVCAAIDALEHTQKVA